MKVFEEGGRFYKGNLHAHTTRSDGRLTPEECVQGFKDHGYDFLGITDHRRMGMAYEDDRILVIPSAEYDHNVLEKNVPDKCWHVTGVGLTREIDQRGLSVQQIVDAIKAQGALCTLCHPAWSMMETSDLLELKNYDAIEIYNTISEVYSGRGYSDQYIDMAASRGVYKLITAVDDCHRYDIDAYGGWIMVQARERTWKSLYEAILSGRFYSSTGPQIYQIERDGDHLSVDMSPVKEVRFMTNQVYVDDRIVRALPGKTITHAEYQMQGLDRYVRVEGRDADGKICWSNLFVR